MSTEYTEHIDEAMRQLPNPAAVPADNRTPQSPNITLEAWNRLQARLVALETLVAKLGKAGFATAVQEDVSALGGNLDSEVSGLSNAITAETERAIAAENTKVDKVTQGGGIRVPTTQPNGSQWFLQVTSEKTGGTAVMRNASGQASFGDPTNDTHAVNLKYLNSELAGKADLVDGKVPAYQLPSYVDDVVEYASLSAFPSTGETGKIYVALDTNLAYRWGGSVYTEISPSVALGETGATAYPGNKGKANAESISALQNAMLGVQTAVEVVRLI